METLDILLAADKIGRDGARSLCRADLTWAAHVVANDIQVTEYFTDLAKNKTVTLFRGVGTWKSQTSYAKAVLAHYSTTGDAAEAFKAIESANRDRKREGKREVWSVQTIAKTLAAAAKVADTDDAGETDADDATDAVTAEPTPVIDVIMSLLPQLDAAGLVTLAAAVAERQALTVAA